MVCEYSPRGNVGGEFREEVKKTGESKDGDPGFGGAPSTRSGMRLLGALAACYMLLAICV